MKDNFNFYFSICWCKVEENKSIIVSAQHIKSPSAPTYRIIITPFFYWKFMMDRRKIYDWFVLYYSKLSYITVFSPVWRSRLSAPLQSLWLIACWQTSYVWEIILYFSRKQITPEKNHRFPWVPPVHFSPEHSSWRRIFIAWLHMYVCA